MSRILITVFLLLLCPLLMAESKSPENAKVYFISPADGTTVKNPVIIKFGLKNMGIAPAGIQFENTGHHHLIVDAELPALEMPVPSDDRHWKCLSPAMTITCTSVKARQKRSLFCPRDNTHYSYYSVITATCHIILPYIQKKLP